MSLLRDLCNLAVSSKFKEFSGRKSQRLSLSNDRIVRMQYLLMCLPEILWELKFRRFTRSSVVARHLSKLFLLAMQWGKMLSG